MCPGSGSFISATRTSLGTSLSARSSTPTSSTVRRPTPGLRSEVAMFKFLQAKSLVKRGLASGKTRRRRASNEMLRNLEHAPWMKVTIFVALRRRARAPHFQRPATGADAQLRLRPPPVRDGGRPALDQSAQNVSAELARLSCLRHHLPPARGDQAPACALQQRRCLRFFDRKRPG